MYPKSFGTTSTRFRPPAVERDRTYHTAIAAKEWFVRQPLLPRSFDIVTIGPHARRSRFTFRQVFGNAFKIGVIALSDRLYDPNHWWETSEGVREVQGEAAAYIYAHIYLLWK